MARYVELHRGDSPSHPGQHPYRAIEVLDRTLSTATERLGEHTAEHQGCLAHRRADNHYRPSGSAKHLELHMAGIQQTFSGVWGMIEGIVRIAWGIVEGIIKTCLSLISGDWEGAWNHIKQM